MGIPQPSVALEAISERGRGVRVEFCWDEDRYVHRIFGVKGTKTFPLLKSVEGKHKDQLPLSPCLTDLHKQDQTAFLTGATPSSYWSLSVQTADIDLRDDLNDGPDLLAKVLRFEVACRMKSDSTLLGSAYRSLEETKCDVLATGNLAFVAGPDTKPSFGILIKSTNQISCESEAILRVTPKRALTNSFPFTIQWSYEIVWALR